MDAGAYPISAPETGPASIKSLADRFGLIRRDSNCSIVDIRESMPLMGRSSFTWLDQSDAARRRFLDAIEQFKDSTTRDELGLGTIRDAFADHFFPGTSVLQTRARWHDLRPQLAGRREHSCIAHCMKSRRRDHRASPHQERERAHVDRQRAVGESLLEHDTHQAVGTLDHSLLSNRRTQDISK